VFEADQCSSSERADLGMMSSQRISTTLLD
jgi:hypothetical protein